MAKTFNIVVKLLRGIIIAILAILTAGAAFGVLLMCVLYFGDLLEPYLGGARYFVSLIATILIANFVCCKIVKPACEVTFGKRGKQRTP